MDQKSSPEQSAPERSGITVLILCCHPSSARRSRAPQGAPAAAPDIDTDLARLADGPPGGWQSLSKAAAVRHIDQALPARTAPHVARLLAARGITVTAVDVRKTRHRAREAAARRTTPHLAAA